MKRIVYIISILSAHFTSAQLYTSGGTVGSTISSTSANVGIGINSPLANLHLVSGFSNPDQTGDLIIGNVDYPNLRFGVNSQYTWIQSHAGSPLYINYMGNNNLIFNNGGGNVGVGISSPSQKLDISGNVLAGGMSSTEGVNAFAVRYVDGSLNNWGSLRGSGATYMSYGAKADGVNSGGWLSSNGTLGLHKLAMTLNDDGVKFMASAQQQITLDSPVTMNEIMKITPNGNAALQGKFEAKEIKVTLTPTADFVFDENYNLPKLEDVEKHVKDKKHLPEIASAKEMQKEGVNIGEFQIKLLQKIEELTLYSIEQNKQLKKQQDKIQQLHTENLVIKELYKEVLQLKKQLETKADN